jgi:hypothetical protein
MLVSSILYIFVFIIFQFVFFAYLFDRVEKSRRDNAHEESTTKRPTEPVKPTEPKKNISKKNKNLTRKNRSNKKKTLQKTAKPEIKEEPQEIQPEVIEETPLVTEKVQPETIVEIEPIPEVEEQEVLQAVQPEVVVEPDEEHEVVVEEIEPEAEPEVQEVEETKELPLCDYPPFTHVRLVEMGLSDDEATEFVNELIPQLEEQVPLIETAINDADFHQIERLTHGIKGSATNLGTGGVSDFLVEFNTYLKSEVDIDIVKAYHTHFIRYIEALKKQYT